MLSNEEALSLIKRSKSSYVVWADDENMIVAVHSLPDNATPIERLQALETMSTDYEGPTRGRFLDSEKVTLELLRNEQQKASETQKRVEIFNSWTQKSARELISMLEKRDFQPPMNLFHSSDYIIDRLYDVRSHELAAPLIRRLEKYASSTSMHVLEESTKLKLECYLAVLTKDKNRLKRLWKRNVSKELNHHSMWTAFTTAAGDMRTSDRQIIDHLIRVVKAPGFFSMRYPAMVALGKIGPSAGEEAATTILQVIYDSSEEIKVLRDRIVLRIRAREDEWVKCERCVRGKVAEFSYDIPGTETCGVCYGIAASPKVS